MVILSFICVQDCFFQNLPGSINDLDLYLSVFHIQPGSTVSTLYQYRKVIPLRTGLIVSIKESVTGNQQLHT